MGIKTFRCLTLVVTVTIALFLLGCGGNSKEQERLCREAEDMVYEAIEAEVEKHRDGAEPNDDQTMMCIKL